jgi:hypothetical protein
VLGVDLFAVRVHLFLVGLGEVENVVRLKFVVPCLACTGLVQQQGFFTLWDGLVIVVLDLPKERDRALA